MNPNQKPYIYNKEISILNRGDSEPEKKKDIFLNIKEKKEKLCKNLSEVECFLSKTSCCLKIFKIRSIFK